MSVQVLDIDTHYVSMVMKDSKNVNIKQMSDSSGNYVAFTGSGKPCRCDVSLAMEQLSKYKKLEDTRFRLQQKLYKKQVPKIENK